MSLFDDMELPELRSHLAYWQGQAAKHPWDRLSAPNMIQRLEALIAEKEPKKP